MGVHAYMTDHQWKPWTPRLRQASLGGGNPSMMAHIVQGELSAVCITPLGEDTGRLCLISPELCLFAFAYLISILLL